jgi:two-component system NtrC family sensor kinase
MVGGNGRILLVEDDLELVRLLTPLLEQHRYAVDSAPDGQTAWNLCRTTAYDGLVVDYQLPDQTGLEWLRRLAEQEPLPPTIMLTAAKEAAVEIEAIRLGVETFLTKDAAGLFRTLLPIYLERAISRSRMEKEKQRAEAELQAHLQMFQAISDTALDAIIVMDGQGRIAHWNPAAQRMFGYRADEAIGQDVHALFAPPEQQQRAAAVAHFLRTGQGPVLGQVLELEGVHKDGARIPIELSVAEIPGTTCCRAVAIVRDISARKRAEAELQRRTEELHFRLKELHCLFGIYRLLEDTESPWEETLQKAVRLIPAAWQYPDAACARIVLGQQVFATDNFEETVWKLAAPIWGAGELAGAVELCYRRPLPEADIGPFLKEEKALLELLADHLGHIIEHLQAQEHIRELKHQIEFVLAATRTRLAITDMERNLLYVDPGTERLYGDPKGRKCYEYFVGANEPCPTCPLGTIADGEVVTQEATLPKENYRPVQVITTAFRNEKGQRRIANVVMDLTERKRLEAELAHSQKLEAIGRLATGIAHEINTPAQYIRSNLQFLQDAFRDLEKAAQCSGEVFRSGGKTTGKPLPSEAAGAPSAEDIQYLCEEIPKALEQSVRGIDEIATIVRAMRQFVQPSSQSKEPVDLNALIQSTLTLCRNEWKYAAEVVTDLAPQLPPVPGIAHDLHQVVLHLVVNAAQAIQEAQTKSGEGAERAGPRRTSSDSPPRAALQEPNTPPPKGTIRVSTRQVGSWVEMRVADNGVGIPPENLPKIFDPFFTTRPVGQGRGQGLSIVRSIVVSGHEGEIDVESQPGQGSTFIVRLPVATSSPPLSLSQKATSPPLHAEFVGQNVPSQAQSACPPDHQPPYMPDGQPASVPHGQPVCQSNSQPDYLPDGRAAHGQPACLPTGQPAYLTQGQLACPAYGQPAWTLQGQANLGAGLANPAGSALSEMPVFSTPTSP